MEPPVSRFASRFRKDASVELLRVKMARRRSQSQKENRELAIAKSRGLALQDPNISTVRESELSVLEAEETFQETRSVLRKPAAPAGVSKAVVERKQMLERYKEAKVLQKMKEQREKAKKGVFKVGVFKPDPQFFLPSVLGQPNTRAQHKVKDPPAPVCTNRVNTRSMAKKPDPPKKGVVSQPLEAPVRKATVLTRGQKQAAAAAAPPASTTHRAVPQPALTRAPVTRASKPSAAPVTVKTRTSHRAATAKGQTKETELKKKPVKDPQVPEESRTVPVPKLKSDAVEMGEHVLETCRQTSEREMPASVPAEQSSAPVESQQPPSFAPDNYVFQPPAWITAHRLTPMSPCSASAFLVPTFRWSPVQRSKSICTLPSGTNTEVTEVSFFAVQDLMRTTVGQARLLMAERFKQFAGLVDDCEFKRGEKETTCTDLEGFWDMVVYQVEDVNKKFTNLTELQESGWQQISHFQPRAKKAVKKKAAPPSRAGKAEGPSVTAARSRLAAVKAAMKARKQEEELQRKVAEEEPKQTVPVVVFDAGFFKVESPAKLQPGKRISRCSTARSCATPLRAVSAEGPDSSRTTGSPLHNVLQTPERPCSPPALSPPCSPDHTQEMNHSAHTRVAAQDVLSRTPNTENEFQVFDFEKYLQPMARLSESPATCLAPWDSVAPLQSLGDAMEMSSPGLQLQDVEMDSSVPPTQLEEPGHTHTVHTPCNDGIKNLETVAPISSPQVAAFLPFTPMIINPARQSLALQDLMMFTPPSS
ncbi:UNVERIFIED_CONTAM: hypothetical protein FKN15_078350 [Acipenser sinensis]